MLHYARQAEERKKKFNAKLAPKNITKGSLVLRYNNRFDYNKSDKFVPHWEGPFKVLEKFDNGSYQLMDASGDLHKTRINGWQLKPYFLQILEDQVDMAQEDLANEEPLGEIAQDPLNAQHVPCIKSMSLGPTTRPCIDTDLCNPGTSSGHLATGGENEYTSRLQEADADDTEDSEQGA